MKQLRGQVNKLLDAISRLSPREQLIVGVGGAAAVVFFVLLAGILFSRRIATKEKELAQLRAGVDEIMALEDSYQQAQARRDAFVKQLAENKLNLRMKVGTIASEQNINIESISESGGSLGAKSSFTEEAIKVQVRRIGFLELFEFFKRLESSSDLLYLKNVQIRRRYDNAEEVDVTFEVATVKPKEA